MDFDAALKLHQSGDLDRAESMYRQVVAGNPRHYEALHLLGVVRLQRGHTAEAITLIRQALAIEPKSPISWLNLGEALRSAGSMNEAADAFRRSIQLAPTVAQPHLNLGLLLEQTGRLPEAAAEYLAATGLDPRSAQAWTNLGRVYVSSGQNKEAAAAFRRVLEIKPGDPEVHHGLGILHIAEAEPSAAIAHYRAVLSVRTDVPHTWANLGNALREIGLHDESIAAHRHSVELTPDDADVGGNLLLALQYAPCEPAKARDEAKRWAERHEKPLRASHRAHATDRAPDRMLRIGYVSPDFRDHSVASFIAPVLRHRNRETFSVVAYSNTFRDDQVTANLRTLCDGWRDIRKLTDDAAAEQIRRDRIDILIDLAGHTSRNRLGIFARKPAPVQMTYLGYPDTTGLSSIDYRITDSLADPVGASDAFYSERLLRLPRTFLCFEPPGDATIKRKANAELTFGSFNRPAKLSGECLDLWSRVLSSIPNSRLILKGFGLGEEATRQHWRRRFEERGVARDRIELIGQVLSAAEHLEMYNRIDIALDTFPYNGTTTTLEAIWMGVPVIALAGTRHVSRVGLSILTNAGLTELVANDAEDYVAIATALAGDADRLRGLHESLRDRLSASPLLDAASFTRDLEAALRVAWQNWCTT